MQIIQQVQPDLGLSVTEAARRAQIIEATIATMDEVGYAGTSFARIVRQANLSSTRIITYHFGTKAGLMQAVLATVTGIKDSFLHQRSDGVRDRAALLRAYVDAEVAFLREHPECARVLVEFGKNGDDAQGWAMSTPLVDEFRTGRLCRQLRQGQQEGVFGEFAPEVVAMAITQSLDGLAAALVRDPELDAERYGRELAGLFDRATRS